MAGIRAQLYCAGPYSLSWGMATGLHAGASGGGMILTKGGMIGVRNGLHAGASGGKCELEADNRSGLYTMTWPWPEGVLPRA